MDGNIEMTIKGPGLIVDIDFTYNDSLFTLIDNILIIKQWIEVNIFNYKVMNVLELSLK